MARLLSLLFQTQAHSVTKSCPALDDRWTAARPAPLSMGFSRHEYWRCCPFLLQGIFSTEGSSPRLLYLLP